MKIRASFVSNSSSSSFIVGHKGKPSGISDKLCEVMKERKEDALDDDDDLQSLAYIEEIEKKIVNALNGGYFLEYLHLDFGMEDALFQIEEMGAIKIVHHME